MDPTKRPASTTSPAAAVTGLGRVFHVGDHEVHALSGVEFTVDRGLVAVRGRSGAGKSTLLNLMGGLDVPTTGTVHVAGEDVAALSADERVRIRRQHVAYVFQSFGLLPMLSAAENVEVPLRLAETAPADRDRRVRELLGRVGLAHRMDHRPQELSGGEQQRVALARALGNHPRLILADEPTGQLDSTTGARIVELLRELVDHDDVTVVVATHDVAVTEAADRVLELSDGRLVADTSGAGS